MTRTLLVSCCALLASCQSLPDGAKEEMAARWTCPPERITTVTREDLVAGELMAAATTPEPPPEVAADPGRLAYFREEQKKHAEKVADAYSSFVVIEAKGCDHQQLLACARKQKVRAGSSSVTCSDLPMPKTK